MLVGGMGDGEGEKKTATERKSKRGREQHVLWRSFKSLVWGRPSVLPLASHLASSCLVPTFGLTQGPPMCVPIFYPRQILPPEFLES